MNVWSWALERIEASRVGSFTYLEPVFAALVAMTFLGERLTLATGAGAALVFSGIYLSTRQAGISKA
jgi:drug/metabolite transporter (DMT)-like permease